MKYVNVNRHDCYLILLIFNETYLVNLVGNYKYISQKQKKFKKRSKIPA
jgi:hypothetical protein